MGRAVREAIAQIGEHDSHVGEHLSRTILTGTYRSYIPHPRVPATWVF